MSNVPEYKAGDMILGYIRKVRKRVAELEKDNEDLCARILSLEWERRLIWQTLGTNPINIDGEDALQRLEQALKSIREPCPTEVDQTDGRDHVRS